MPVTVNKGWSLPTVGGSAGVWGNNINDLLSIADANIGGHTSVSLSGSNITLTDAQTNNNVIRFTGVMSANITVTLTPTAGGPSNASGFWLVDNQTTGTFALNISNGIGGLARVSQGVVTLVIADPVNGCRSAISDNFPPGQILVTGSLAAPVGWIKLLTHNNKALRLIGAGTPGFGGSTPFTSIFSGRTITVDQLPPHSHSVNDPGHAHNYLKYAGLTQGGEGGYGIWVNGVQTPTSVSTTGITITNTGSNAQIDFSVQYVDVNMIQKN